MIVGLGTDILQISRMQIALERTPGLAERILRPEEFAEYQQQKDQVRFLSKRFAAKEAVAKALGTGIARGVSWQHLLITKEPTGRPGIALNGGAQVRAEQLGISNLQLSYSDEKEYVVAFVVAEADG